MPHNGARCGRGAIGIRGLLYRCLSSVRSCRRGGLGLGFRRCIRTPQVRLDFTRVTRPSTATISASDKVTRLTLVKGDSSADEGTACITSLGIISCIEAALPRMLVRPGPIIRNVKRFTCPGSSWEEPAFTFAFIGNEGGVLLVTPNRSDWNRDMSEVISRCILGRVASEGVMHFASSESKREGSDIDVVGWLR